MKSLRDSREVEFEILIVTSDESLLELPGARVIFQKGGPALKRNVGVKFAQGEYIAFFDDDVEVMPYALYYMKKTLIVQGAGMVFGKLLNLEFRNKFDEAGSYLTPFGFLWARAESGCADLGQFETAEPVLAGKSAACLIYRKIFWNVGGFDPSYEILGEETDLAWRVWLSGNSVFYAPRSVTFHAFNTKFKPADFYTPSRVYFNGCKNYLSMLTTNLENFNLAIPITCQIVIWFVAALGMLATGKFQAGGYILKGIAYYFRNLKSILMKRHKVQSSRKISDKELMPIIRRMPPISYFVNRLFSYIKTGRHG